MVPNQQLRSIQQSPRRIVLLVEDEPFVRDATCRTLEKAGFEVFSTANAQEAMNAYALLNGDIDLLMSDITLPGRSGRELSLELRSKSAKLPILLTSGYNAEEGTRESQDTGTHFLPKPYSRVELVAALEKIFRFTEKKRPATQGG
jgi:DNA-binding response OmpR family regulator